MMNTKLFSGLILSLILLLAIINSNAREVISINKNWSYKDGIELPRGLGWGFGRTTSDTVNLPHTWNSKDFMSEEGYRRGYGSYRRNLEIPGEYEGKRLFLKFEGAGTVANVFVNSNHMGEHKGAYNAFTYEITDVVNYGGRNSVSVICDNSQRFDVAPQGGDFNMYGGLYRDAWLIVTGDDACISPLYYSSNGVLIHQLYASEKRAELRAEIHLSTKSDYVNCNVEFSVFDADDKPVFSEIDSILENDGAVINVGITNPHLWNGKEDPYLYKTVTILSRNGEEIDRVEETIGIRYFYVDADKGFFLNGEHLKLNGVCRHQDWAGVASALTEENHLVDYAFFDEIGANSLRLAHYPQAKFMFQEADRRGYVVWEEIPFVGGYINSDAFEDNLKCQLKELIIQNFNHPSICFWGLFNEIRGDFDAITAELNDLAHQIDPTRLTVAASYQPGSFNHITDVIAWNKYFGWYYDKIEDFGPFYDDFHAQYPHAKVGLSEYGAGGSINQHVSQFIPEDNPRPTSRGPWHPEEKQTANHIGHIKMITERDFIWGSYIWNMFNFGSNHRREGDTPHENDKGLVTMDRKIRKDAFFLYKANWNKDEKTVHLCSKRFTVRKEDITDVVVFTTAPSAELFINGKQVGKMDTDDYATIIWKNVKLNQGRNLVEIKTADGNDSAEWTVN
jgi:beta-galactosidase